MEPDHSKAPSEASSRQGRHRPLLGLGFWLLMAFGVACVLFGIFIAHYGPQIFGPNHTAASSAAPASVSSVSAPSTQIDETLAPVAEASATPAKPVLPDAELFAINQRVGRLEAEQHQQASASASALAASALQQAAQTSQPFDEDLKAVEPLLPARADLRTLRRLAQAGAPTRSALASSFPEVAARAAVAARTPAKESGPFAEALHVLASIVTIRRVDRLTGKGPDAVLARAERLLNDGELDAALKTLDDLPKDAKLAMAQWRSGLERRAEIDRQIAGLRASALKDLSHSVEKGAGQ
jgi:hypothetical protein